MVLELKKRPRPRSPSFTTPVAVMKTLAGLISLKINKDTKINGTAYGEAGKRNVACTKLNQEKEAGTGYKSPLID